MLAVHETANGCESVVIGVQTLMSCGVFLVVSVGEFVTCLHYLGSVPFVRCSNTHENCSGAAGSVIHFLTVPPPVSSSACI